MAKWARQKRFGKERVRPGMEMMRLERQAFNRHVKEVLLPRTRAATGDALLTIALELMKLVMEAWPVDTGRSRAAWRALFEKHGVPLPVSPTGKPEEAEGAVQGAVEEKLTGPKQYIAMINGVFYSVFLEAGWSGQAPAGALRISMEHIRKTTPAHFKTAYRKIS